MELSKDHQAPATLPGLCYVQTARQPTHTKNQNCVWDVRRFILLTNLVTD